MEHFKNYIIEKRPFLVQNPLKKIAMNSLFWVELYNSGEIRFCNSDLSNLSPFRHYKKLLPETLILEEPVVDIQTGQDFFIALTESGKLRGWGRNEHGCLTLPEFDTVIKAIWCGREECIALDELGKFWKWGQQGLFRINSRYVLLDEDVQKVRSIFVLEEWIIVEGFNKDLYQVKQEGLVKIGINTFMKSINTLNPISTNVHLDWMGIKNINSYTACYEIYDNIKGFHAWEADAVTITLDESRLTMSERESFTRNMISERLKNCSDYITNYNTGSPLSEIRFSKIWSWDECWIAQTELGRLLVYNGSNCYFIDKIGDRVD